MQAATPLQHSSVLLHEAIDALVTRTDGVYVDGTFGRGGHARLLLARLSAGGRLIAFDRDPEAVAAAAAPGDGAIADARFTIHHVTFGQMKQTLAELGVERVDGVLL